MGTLLIIILLLIFGWPIFQGLWKIFVNARRIKKFMNDPASFFTGFNGGTQPPKAEARPKRSKKFSREEGEYVEFTDIACNVDVKSDSGEVHYRREEQITDIDWVDIEDKK